MAIAAPHIDFLGKKSKNRLAVSKIMRTFAMNKQESLNPNTFYSMEDKKLIPDFGYVAYVGELPNNLPKPKVVKCGNKNRNHAPIRVKRAIRTGVRVYQSGESVNWPGAYD